MHRHFQMMAQYNTWANRRLYDAAGQVPDQDYRRDLGAFFKSLHGTLNHLLVGDRIWMDRFTASGRPPPALTTLLYDRLEDLRQAREAEDARIEHYIAGLTAEKLGSLLTYRTVVNPTEISQPLDRALAHFFNHQTHHRGQAHALLTQILGSAPSFDLIYFQRETGTGLSGSGR